MNLSSWKSLSWGSRNNCIPCPVFYSSQMTFISWSLWTIAIMGRKDHLTLLLSVYPCHPYDGNSSIPTLLTGQQQEPRKKVHVPAYHGTTQTEAVWPFEWHSCKAQTSHRHVTDARAAPSSSTVLHLKAAGQAGTRSRQSWIYSSATLGRWLNVSGTQLSLL